MLFFLSWRGYQACAGFCPDVHAGVNSGGRKECMRPLGNMQVVCLILVPVLGLLAMILALQPLSSVVEEAEAYTGGGFQPDSWWNTPVPAKAPSHDKSWAILNYLRTAEQNGGGFLRLSGAGTNPWGQPIFWAGEGDKAYEVKSTAFRLPPEFSSLRMPASAQAGDNSDSQMTVYDVERGYVAMLWRAVYDASTDTWSAGGGGVTYLASNGLHAKLAESDDARNTGPFRGNNGAVAAARYDEVAAGAIDHVLKIAVGPEASTEAVFPMIGSDGDDPASPVKQGLRLRIKPSVDLKALKLHPEALVIAKAIQRYGVYVGDSAGVTALKLENTSAEGRGQLWTVPADALSKLPFTPEIWEVLPEGYESDQASTGAERDLQGTGCSGHLCRARLGKRDRGSEILLAPMSNS